MTRLTSFLAALLAAGLPGVPCLAHAAQAPRVAVVVGNASYPGLPSLPACAASARAMADTLGTLGFDIVRAENANSGDSGAQLARLDARLRAVSPPGAAVIVYLCGYARSLEGRRFLLPVDARIDQPTDLLAQGVLPQSFVRVASAAGSTGGAVLLDVFAVPGQPEAADAADTIERSFGLAVAAHPAPAASAGTAATVTPLASAAIAALAVPGADTGSVIAAVRVAAGETTIAALAPSAPTTLDPPAAPTHAVAGMPAAAPGAVAEAILPPPTASATPPTGAGQGTAPDMSTEAGRRTAQQDLVRLGYYAGPVDGIAGPDTAAAIRRLQHELGDPLTGALGPAEIDALRARSR